MKFGQGLGRQAENEVKDIKVIHLSAQRNVSGGKKLLQAE